MAQATAEECSGKLTAEDLANPESLGTKAAEEAGARIRAILAEMETQRAEESDGPETPLAETLRSRAWARDLLREGHSRMAEANQVTDQWQREDEAAARRKLQQLQDEEREDQLQLERLQKKMQQTQQNKANQAKQILLSKSKSREDLAPMPSQEPMPARQRLEAKVLHKEKLSLATACGLNSAPPPPQPTQGESGALEEKPLLDQAVQLDEDGESEPTKKLLCATCFVCLCNIAFVLALF